MKTEFSHNGTTIMVIEELNQYGRNVILHTSPVADLNNITEDRFVEFMADQLAIAAKKYRDIVVDEIAAIKAAKRAAHLEQTVAILKRKYIRQSTIDKHAAEEMDKFDKNLENWYKNADSISFTCWPGPHHGTPGLVTGLSEHSSIEALKRAYQELVKNEWFKKGTGLVFKYNCNKENHLANPCPQIDVALSEADEAAAIAGQKAIDDDITRFYANCRYCGD